LNLTDLDEVKEIAKNIKSANLINKNVLVAATSPAIAKVKELKTQILELRAELKELKYVT